MRWVLRLIATDDDARRLSTDLVEICRPEGLGDIANLGLTLPEGSRLTQVVGVFDKRGAYVRGKSPRVIFVSTPNSDPWSGAEELWALTALDLMSRGCPVSA